MAGLSEHILVGCLDQSQGASKNNGFDLRAQRLLANLKHSIPLHATAHKATSILRVYIKATEGWGLGFCAQGECRAERAAQPGNLDLEEFLSGNILSKYLDSIAF